MKKTGKIADQFTRHPHPPKRNNWGNPKDRPRVKDQHNGHKMKEREGGGQRRPPPPKRSEEQIEGKLRQNKTLKTLKKKKTLSF